MGRAPERRRGAALAAGLGLLVVTAYAVVGALQTLVWNPSAAVPGAGLGEIYAGVERADESMNAPLVVAWAVLVWIAAAAVLWGARRPDSGVRRAVILDLLLIALAGPAHWVASFGAGMAVADTFGTSGGDHAPWAAVLYGISAAALVAFAVVRLGQRPGAAGASPAPSAAAS
ncbi:hypothetical protein [Zhihengliuella alba]